MAVAGGPPSDHLNYFRRVAEVVRKYEFFALLRWGETRAPALPRIGRSLLPSQNVADLAHGSTLDFPGATLDGVEFTLSGRARIRSVFLGLTGPMGPLPLHLTEFAQYEQRYARSRPFGRFLDLLTDRFLQYFFRAWADTQPAVHADRKDDDRFADYLTWLSGARAGVPPGAALPLRARLPYLGIYISKRSPSAIQDCLVHLLKVRAGIQEFIARWRTIVPQDRTRIGRQGAFNVLGQGAVLGRRVNVVDDTFRVTLDLADMREYGDYLPSGAKFALAREALDALAPSHLDWEIELHIDERKVTRAALDGATALGWTSWLQPQGRPTLRRDARLVRGHDRRADSTIQETAP